MARGLDRLGVWAEEQRGVIKAGGELDGCGAHPDLDDDGMVAEPLDLVGLCGAELV